MEMQCFIGNSTTKDCKFTTARNLSTPRWLVFSSRILLPLPAPLPSLVANNGGVHLTMFGTQTWAQIFRCRFNSTCMTDREFFPVPLPSPSSSSFLSRSCSLTTFSTSIRKKLLRVDLFARERPQPQPWFAFPTERYQHTVEISMRMLLSLLSCVTHRYFLFNPLWSEYWYYVLMIIISIWSIVVPWQKCSWTIF